MNISTYIEPYIQSLNTMNINIEAYIYLFFCCTKILILYPTVHFILNYNSKYKDYDFNKKTYIIKKTFWVFN